MKLVAWFLYRRARLWWYSAIQKNPLAGTGCRLTFAQEWDSAAGLLEARKKAPQLIETDRDGNSLWDTSCGNLWVPPNSDEQYLGMISSEIHSNVYYLDGVGKSLNGATVLDCGANVGVFSRYALEHGAARVIAFEPSPVTAECLRRNLAEAIQDGRAVVVEKGLWDRDTTLYFSTGTKGNPGSHHIVEDAALADIEIPVTTIDAVVKAHGLPRVDYIKMDIEGSEVRALRGGKETIQAAQPTCVIATEHTSDLMANTKAVIETIREIHPEYRHICTETHVYTSPSHGTVLTPYTVHFHIPGFAKTGAAWG